MAAWGMQFGLCVFNVLLWSNLQPWFHSHEIKGRLLPGRKAMTNLDSVLKSRDCFTDKVSSGQSYGFSSSLVGMWELDYKESWVPKNWCFWTVCWRRLLRVPWTSKRSNQSILKEINPECSLEGLKVKSNTLATWCEELNHWKRPWCWEKLRAWGEGVIEDEMVGWHHWLNGHEFEQTLGDGEEQGSLLCCSPWGRKELDMT